MDFLNQYDWKLVETEDTALSAKHIHQRKSKHIAGIASGLAAQFFQLEMIAPDIQTMKNNYTRFLVFGKEILPVKRRQQGFRYFSYRPFDGEAWQSADADRGWRYQPEQIAVLPDSRK